ncbi:MFS-type transporter SLC18B1-like isoform X2 [Trematomus bernacchii]|uniref:MFS-type transporter SLC18B1-like isoform X2 n=1 Tax=Trematomus bernacchii TaxID=40690 RepID=UPI00146B93CA|nr:MFS-type transporter SLC18B1-like isoform X2 [Trematomus bernacchii]
MDSQLSADPPLEPRPPRMTRQQILTLISVASVNFSSMICYSILGPFFPTEAVKKGASQTVIGLIFGCYAVFNLIASLIMGKYIVQIGAKFMLVAGLFVSAGSTIMFGLLTRVPPGAPFIALCFVVRSVDAVGLGAACTSSFAITAQIFPNNVATVLGSLEMFAGLGLILGPPVGGWFYESFGYEVPFMLLGGLLFLMVPFNILVLPNIQSEPSKDSLFGLLRKTKISLICFVIFTLSSGFGFLDAALSLFAIQTFGLSLGYVGLIMLGLSLPYCLASPLLGLFTDKYPSSRPWLMVIGCGATALSFFLLGPAPILHIPSQLWLLVLMLSVIGFSLGMTAIPTFPEIISSAYEQGYEEGLSTLGMVSGLFGAFWSLGMFSGPIVGGLVTQHLSFEWASVLQGGSALLAALLLAVYYLRHPPSQRMVSESPTTSEHSPLLSD